MANALHVWREYFGEVQHVGAIREDAGLLSFSYDEDYAGEPISVSFPLTDAPFDSVVTERFFSALLPEGDVRKNLIRAFHATPNEFAKMLSRLNDESVGALLFSVSAESPYSNPEYRLVDAGLDEALAFKGVEVASGILPETRLSLPGCVAKVGLYRDPGEERWFYPLGGAPSTHIVKSSDIALSPSVIVNESLCMQAARDCGFDVADTEIIRTENGGLLLAIRRYDRLFLHEGKTVSGLPAPMRIHQEDFQQAMGMREKYEPTEGEYLLNCADMIKAACSEPFGEVACFVEATFFNYLIGNCDNHLKNHSLLYDSDWKTRSIAPLYDLVSTTIYPTLSRDMGLSIGGSVGETLSIDAVSGPVLQRALDKLGASGDFQLSSFAHNKELALRSLAETAKTMKEQGFADAEETACEISSGIVERYDRALFGLEPYRRRTYARRPAPAQNRKHSDKSRSYDER